MLCPQGSNQDGNESHRDNLQLWKTLLSMDVYLKYCKVNSSKPRRNNSTFWLNLCFMKLRNSICFAVQLPWVLCPSQRYWNAPAPDCQLSPGLLDFYRKYNSPQIYHRPILVVMTLLTIYDDCTHDGRSHYNQVYILLSNTAKCTWITLTEPSLCGTENYSKQLAV